MTRARHVALHRRAMSSSDRIRIGAGLVCSDVSVQTIAQQVRLLSINCTQFRGRAPQPSARADHALGPDAPDGHQAA